MSPPPPHRPFPPNAVHLLRTAQASHLQLSAMADQKASILMGASFVIFTIALSETRAPIADMPLIMLAATAFVSALLAILAVLPATRYPATARPNLLFFGAFAHIEEEEYVARMVDLVADEENLYAAMARDLHQNGRVLARRKYRFLALAYRAFLGGMVLSFAAFAVQVAAGGRPA